MIPVGSTTEDIPCAVVFNLDGIVLDARALELSYFYGLGAQFIQNGYLFLCDFI